MKLRNVILCASTITMLSVASDDAKENRLRIDVSPRISSAPAAVRVRAFVVPDSANRLLEIAANSDSFYRRSLVPLDGANAALLTEMVFKNLPGGEYEVSVALVGADGGSTVDKREVTVTSSLFGHEGDPRHGTADDPRIVLIGIDVHAAVFLEVDKPKPIVLFELAKGWLTGERIEAGETHRLREPHK